MKTYLKVTWRHESCDEPVALYHEVDDAGIETRRIELFADGRLARTSAVEPDAKSSLSLEPLPSAEAINAQPEFCAEALARGDFEDIWQRAQPQR